MPQRGSNYNKRTSNASVGATEKIPPKEADRGKMNEESEPSDTCGGDTRESLTCTQCHRMRLPSVLFCSVSCKEVRASTLTLVHPSDKLEGRDSSSEVRNKRVLPELNRGPHSLPPLEAKEIDPAHVSAYEKNGYVVIRRLFDEKDLRAYVPYITSACWSANVEDDYESDGAGGDANEVGSSAKTNRPETPPSAEKKGSTTDHSCAEKKKPNSRVREETKCLAKKKIAKPFLRVHNLWRISDFVRRLVMSKRLARVAKDLVSYMQVDFGFKIAIPFYSLHLYKAPFASTQLSYERH